MNKDKVGRGQPPKETQFKKGKSGNPKGRPKGSPNITTIINKQLSSQITIQENGVARRVPRMEAVAMKLFAEAMKGNSKAIATVIALGEKAAAANPEDKPPSGFTQLDREIIRRFAPPILDEIAKEAGKSVANF